MALKSDPITSFPAFLIIFLQFIPSKKRYWKIVANNAFKKEILDSHVAKEVVNSPNSVVNLPSHLLIIYSSCLLHREFFFYLGWLKIFSRVCCRTQVRTKRFGCAVSLTWLVTF